MHFFGLVIVFERQLALFYSGNVWYNNAMDTLAAIHLYHTMKGR